MKLYIPQYQVSREKAEKYILYLSKELNIPIKSKNDLKGEFEIETEGKTIIEMDFLGTG